MTQDSPRENSEPEPGPEPGTEPEPDPTFREAFGAAIRGAGLSQVAPGEIPTAGSLLAAVGGIRGLVESILPGLGFLVIYAATRNVAAAVSFPVAVAIVFVVVRFATRTSATGALAGLAGVALSAFLALASGRAEDNFVPGIIINVVSLAVLLISLLVRIPLIGVVVGILANEPLSWRADPAKKRILTIATLLWVLLFAVRLGAELPLYFSGQVELLATVKLVLGVPFYAVMLWITWLLVRSVYGRRAPAGESAV